MSSLRLLGNIFDLEILLGERSGTFRDYAGATSVMGPEVWWDLARLEIGLDLEKILALYK